MDQLFFGFPPIQQALEKLATLTEEQFNSLRDEVLGPETFSRGYHRCEKLAEKLGADLSPRDVFNILTSLEFLYDNARSLEASERPGHDALKEFLEFTGLDETLGEKSDLAFDERVRPLVATNAIVERRRKIRRLKSTLIDTAMDFASFVDVRPSFADDRSRIEELVPMVFLSVGIRTEEGPDKTFFFQMSREGFAKLHSTVADIEKKLAAVNSDEHLGPLVQIDSINGDNEDD